MSYSKKLSAVLFLAAVATQALLAQSTDGSITGRVVDNQQAALTNATINATEANRKVTLTTKTDGTGRFVFAVAPPGDYTISVEAAGFKKLDRKGITLNASDRLTLGDLTMEIGAITQSIEVSAEAVTLKTESAERSDSLVSKQIENIAVNGRNALDLIKTMPGIVSTANFQIAGAGGLGNISANGARQTQNATTINGIGNVDTGANGSQNVTVSIDSIQEFKVFTSSYQAEYGKSSGAQIQMLTKSGTSAFHGSMYWDHRNESLNANNWKNNRDGLQRNKLRLNDIGFTIGGPVMIPKIFTHEKNKLFFFASQEYQRQLAPNGTKNATLPTAAERGGDFSQTVDNNGNPFPYIKDPTTPAGTCSNATNISGCFQSGGVLGVIPKSRLYAPGIALLNFYPQPNAISPNNKGFNFQSQLSDVAPRREDLVRIDYNLSSSQRVFGHWINNANRILQNYGTWSFGYNFPVSPLDNNTPGNSYAVGHTWIISPTMTNDFLIGDTHNVLDHQPSTNGFSRTKTGILLPLAYPKADQLDLIPAISFGGRIGNSPNISDQYAPFVNYNTTIDITDNVTKVIGRHTAKAGIYMQRSRKDQTGFSASNGNYNFQNDTNNPLDTGFGFANAAIGVFQKFTQSNAYLNGMYRYTNLEGYVQDTWKIAPRVTLDFGMRMAWYQPQFDASLQTSTFVPSTYSQAQVPVLYRPVVCATCTGGTGAQDPRTGAITTRALIGYEIPGTGSFTNGIQQAGKGISKYLMRDAGLLWAPRFGVAWDVTGHQNFVVRTGGGIFYDRIQGNKTFDMITNPPSTISPDVFYGYASDIGSGTAALAPPGIHMADLNGEIPTVYSWNFGIQSKIFKGFVLDTAYVASKSEHNPNQRNLNAIPYGTTFLAQNQDPTKTGNATLGSNALPVNFLRPYPGYGDITVYEDTGYSNYNSLQATLSRRFEKGLFLGASYTWSHALGNTSGDGDYRRIDQYDRQANYANESFDRRHNLVVNYVYDVPSLFRSGIAHTVLDGWQFSGITTLQSGSPFNPGISFASGEGNVNITGSYTEGFRAVVLSNPATGSNDPYNRLNYTALAAPKVGTIGLDGPVRYLRNPGILNFDMSLQKTFSIKERAHLEMRVDAFNAANHTQFSGINSGLTFTSIANPTPTNLVYKADGTLNNKNGFGSVSGARDPRIVQTLLRLTF